MSRLYKDLLQGYKEIGEIENNPELVKMAEDYLKSSTKKKKDNYIIAIENKTKSTKNMD